YANHGWLDTHHTFSFASYFDYKLQGFGSLRVINEDIVQPTTGSGTHPHREFEIFSYIISGPISIAQYMKEVLTSSLSGYYMVGDVFGRQGDF
ncbi:1444_t:CDS:2, partial [Dentiscutata erythropus]